MHHCTIQPNLLEMKKSKSSFHLSKPQPPCSLTALQPYHRARILGFAEEMYFVHRHSGEWGEKAYCNVLLVAILTKEDKR